MGGKANNHRTAARKRIDNIDTSGEVEYNGLDYTNIETGLSDVRRVG